MPKFHPSVRQIFGSCKLIFDCAIAVFVKYWGIFCEAKIKRRTIGDKKAIALILRTAK